MAIDLSVRCHDQVAKKNIVYNHNYLFSLHCRVGWSKYVTEERDAPLQLVLGAMDHRICPLINLAIYLGNFSHRSSDSKNSSFGLADSQTGHQSVRNILNKVIESERFEVSRPEPVGEYINRRGRWRSSKTKLIHISQLIFPFRTLELQAA